MLIVLPIPVSINAAYANVPGRGRVKTKAYRQWIKNADAYLMIQKRVLVRFEGPAVVVINLPAKMRGDVSNRAKLAEDYLVSRNITADDRHNWEVTARRSPDVPAGFCHVEVRPA